MDSVNSGSEGATLPSGWRWVKLGEVADYINGMAFKPSDWESEGRKIVRIQNLTGTSDEFNYSKRNDIASKYIVKRGDLLISWSATIGFFIWDDEDAILNQHIFKVVLKPNILLKYLFYCKAQIIAAMTDNVHGNTMRHITKGRFESIKIPLPPLSEQERIVRILDEKLGVIEKAKRAAEEQVEAVDALSGGYLREAIPSGDARLPKGWRWVKLGEVAEIVMGQSPPGSSYNESGVGTPFFQGKADFGDKYLGNAKKWTIDPRRFADTGDILISVRAPVGPVNLATSRISIGRGLAAIKPIADRLDTAFTFYVLRHIEPTITGNMGSVFSSINKREIQGIPIALPSFTEQKQIVRALDEKLATVEKANQTVEAQMEAINALSTACLRQAFAGGL